MGSQEFHEATFGDVAVEVGDDHVAVVEIQRPPHNFFDLDLIESLVTTCRSLDEHPGCRSIVLCSAGKHFCAGADFGDGQRSSAADDADRHLYDAAVDLFACRTPIVAAVHGAAIGGGLGLACMADFRITAPEARFSANFARLGFHHGFGLTVTLPMLVGGQRALELLYTGRRIGGDEAAAIGLADRLVALADVRDAAHDLAREIAMSAPLAVRSIRDTMRGDLAERIRTATDHERAEQDRLRHTDDWREGVAAMAERRTPDFTGS